MWICVNLDAYLDELRDQMTIENYCRARELLYELSGLFDTAREDHVEEDDPQ